MTPPLPFGHDDDHRVTALILVACVAFMLALFVLGSCTGAQQQQARQVFKLAQNGCAVLEGVTDDPRVAGACLTRAELQTALEAILRARDAAAALASASAPQASPPPTASAAASR